MVAVQKRSGQKAGSQEEEGAPLPGVKPHQSQAADHEGQHRSHRLEDRVEIGTGGKVETMKDDDSAQESKGEPDVTQESAVSELRLRKEDRASIRPGCRNLWPTDDSVFSVGLL